VDANILSLFGDVPEAFGKTFNVACGDTLSINRVFSEIHSSMVEELGIDSISPIHLPTRDGDIKDSLADLSEVSRCLGYSPKISFAEGIEETVSWFLSNKV